MAGVFALCAVGGCGGDDDADPKPAERWRVVAEHVGKTDDRDLFVAVALDPQGKVKGYACDGAVTALRLTARSGPTGSI